MPVTLINEANPTETIKIDHSPIRLVWPSPGFIPSMLITSDFDLSATDPALNAFEKILNSMTLATIHGIPDPADCSQAPDFNVDDYYLLITHFFTVWFKNKGYQSLLKNIFDAIIKKDRSLAEQGQHNTIFTQTDTMIDAMLQVKEDGTIWLNLYQINRTLMHGLAYEPQEWTITFYNHLVLTLDFIKHGMETSGEEQLTLKQLTYPNQLLEQLEKKIECAATAKHNKPTRYPINDLFYKACIAGAPEDIQELLEMDTELVNINNGQGRTPLHLTILHDRTDNALTLLQSNLIIVNVTDEWDETPLHLAVKKGNKPIIRALLQQPGIDLKRCNLHQQTPLMIAEKSNDLPAIRLLQSVTLIQKLAGFKRQIQWEQSNIRPGDLRFFNGRPSRNKPDGTLAAIDAIITLIEEGQLTESTLPDAAKYGSLGRIMNNCFFKNDAHHRSSSMVISTQRSVYSEAPDYASSYDNIRGNRMDCRALCTLL